jgi:putative hydrolases of HD superfamily
MKKISARNRNVELMFEIGTLRHIERTWKNFMNPDVANCAEHMYRVLWLALTISKMENIGNHEKILKIALMHDVTESRTGDTNYISRQYVKRDDEMALGDIFEGTVHEEETKALFREYEERNSIEARIVKDADTIDIEMELAELRAKGHSLGKVFVKDRRVNVYTRLYTKSAKKLWDALAVAEPHDWHLSSPRNRHKGGDWKKKK